MTTTLYPGDNRISLRDMIDRGERVDAVVTDPPYGLVSIQKRFGKKGSAAARTEGNDGSFSRLSGGFMGKAWDATEIERDPEFWKLVLHVLKPGGYCFAFGGSRTAHWQAVAMEMAGFILHPLHGWVYGSGFPKAHNASKAIDKSLGIYHLRKEIGLTKRHGGGIVGAGTSYELPPEKHMETAAASPEAQQWEGWAYGTQAQKPALEPIYLAQRPFSEKTGAANLLKHGVGAVNIDGCRVGESGARNNGRKADSSPIYGDFGPSERVDYGKGRHPSNLILDGSDCVIEMFPNDTARFFHHFPPDMDPLFYHPKANRLDRGGSSHPTVKPVNLLRYLIRHITPEGGTVLDPFAGSGSTGAAAQLEGFNCILMESEQEYVSDIKRRFGTALTVDGSDSDISDLFLTA